jgi:hypothetical protein
MEGVMSISTVKMMDICRQKLAEAIRWHIANSNQASTTDKTDAYYAGYLHGFREALATVRLHGYEEKDHE